MATDSKIILIIAFETPVRHFVERLRKSGARPGDFILVSQWLVAYGGWDFTDTESFPTLDLLVSGFEMSQREYAGEMGDWFKERMIEEKGEFISWAWFHYDKVFALARGFDWFLTQGRDYEDPVGFIEGIRETRFTGCSGHISYHEHSNDRYALAFTIRQV